jgi:RNA polymerase sigma factor (sigma-70 family)
MRINESGNGVDWPTVVRVHGPTVWQTVYRLLGTAEEARDCYQEVFLMAVQAARRGPVVNWSAFLRATATRRAIDHLRRRRVRKRRWGIGLIGEEPVDPGPGVAAGMEQEDLCERVRRLLAELPPRQAQAFWLRHMEQASVEEIARQLEIAPGNVYVLLNRAGMRLREALGVSAATGENNKFREVAL